MDTNKDTDTELLKNNSGTAYTVKHFRAFRVFRGQYLSD